MPMPREEDDDLFPTEADVDFIDTDEKPKKKTAKKKTAKKAATGAKRAPKTARAEKAEKPEREDKAAPKKKVAATKKVAKKKSLPVADYDDTPRVKPARAKRPAKGAPVKPPKKLGGFGAGLFDDQPLEEEPIAAPSVGQPAAPAYEAEPVYSYLPDEDAPKPTASEGKPKAYEGRSDYGRPDAAHADFGPGPVEDQARTDEYGRPEPLANYVVHIYELGRFKRTIDRAFTPEAAEAFATEFSRTSKRYGRKAVTGKKDTQPAKESV